MTKGLNLLRAAIEEKGHSNVRYLKENLFTPEELPAYKFFIEYYGETGGEIPPLEAFLRKGIKFPAPVSIPGKDNSFLYNYRLVVERQKFEKFNEFLESSKNCRNVKLQRELAEKYLSSVNGLELEQKVYDAEQLIDLSWRKYQLNKELVDKGELLGVSSGWSEFDHLIHFYQPGNLYVFSGRRNLGKSYLIARMVLRALVKRSKVLLVTMEMTAEEFADRLATIQCAIDPDDLMEGRLPPDKFEKYKTTVENFSQYPLRTVEGGFDKTVFDVIADTKEFRPDIVFIDGSYMLNVEGFFKSDWEKQGRIHEMLKMALAKECKVPVVCTVQEKRGKKGIDEGTVSRSDIIEQITSVLVSISKVKGNEHKRLLNIMKNRHGKCSQFVINFCFDKMNMNIDIEETRKVRDKFRNGDANRDHRNNLRDMIR